MLSLLVLVTGCGTQPESAPVRIFDGIKVLEHPDEVVKALRPVAEALEARLILVSAAEANPRTLSVEADRAGEKLNEEQYWPLMLVFPRSARSITLFYTKHPELLQVRYGRTFRYRARRAGIDYGPEYNEIQAMRLENGTPDFVGIATRIAQRLQTAHIPFYMSWVHWFVTWLDDELLPLVAIPVFELWEGMASLVAVHVYNFLGNLLPNYFAFSAVLMFLLFLALLLMTRVAAPFSTPVVEDSGHVTYHANSMPGCLVILAMMAFLVAVAYPMLGFLVLSAGHRAEDIITTQALGINVGFIVPQEFDWYVVSLLAFVTMVVQVFATIATGGENEAFVRALKTLVVVPIVYFMLPAWTIVMATSIAINTAFFGIIGSHMAKRDIAGASEVVPPGDVAKADGDSAGRT